MIYRIQSVQQKFLMRREFIKIKKTILKGIVDEYQDKILMKSIKNKKPKVEEKIRGVTDEIKEAVIRRYFTYCIKQNG